MRPAERQVRVEDEAPGVLGHQVTVGRDQDPELVRGLAVEATLDPEAAELLDPEVRDDGAGVVGRVDELEGVDVRERQTPGRLDLRSDVAAGRRIEDAELHEPERSRTPHVAEQELVGGDVARRLERERVALDLGVPALVDVLARVVLDGTGADDLEVRRRAADVEPDVPVSVHDDSSRVDVSLAGERHDALAGHRHRVQTRALVGLDAGREGHARGRRVARGDHDVVVDRTGRATRATTDLDLEGGHEGLREGGHVDETRHIDLEVGDPRAVAAGELVLRRPEGDQQRPGRRLVEQGRDVLVVVEHHPRRAHDVLVTIRDREVGRLVHVEG